MGETDGTRKIMLDKERTLRLDFNALALAESLTKKNFIDVQTWKDLNASEYRALAYACLLDEDPTLTLEGVGRMMTRTNEKVIADALLELYLGEVAAAPIDTEKTASLPLAKDGGGGEP